MLLSRSMAIWICGWLLLVAILVCADIFLFKPPSAEREHAVIPSDSVPADGTLTASWLGPPYYAGAREGTWVETMLEERFNLELKPIFMDPNGYNRKKPLMIAGGPIPDFIWEADPIGLQKAVEHGFISEVPLELIARRMPVYFREMTEEAPIAWLYSMVDGRNYGIPSMLRAGALPKPGIWRMDWLRKLGMEEPPDTLEEFEQALRLISKGDPDGNGIADTYGMSGDISNWWWVAFTEIFGAYGVLPFDWQEVNGRITWGGIRPETREVLALLRRWYEEGLIHPEFVTDNMLPGQSLDRKFLSGKIGYIYYRGEQWNLNFTQSGSYAFNFLNLQYTGILNNSEGAVEMLVDEVPVALLFYGLSEQVLQKTEGSINRTVANWILKNGLQNPLLFHELYQPNSNRRNKVTYPDHPTAEQKAFLDLRDSLLKQVLDRLPEPVYRDFCDFIRGQVRTLLTSEGIDSAQRPFDRESRAQAVEMFGSDRLDPLLEEAWKWLQERGVLSLKPKPTTFRGLILSHYGRLMYNNLCAPALLPAPFPAGPDGSRGVRTWGKGGNILSFGRQVADSPGKAVRILDMLEEMYTDRVLFRETQSGREGIHWEWIDPVLKENGLFGFSLKKDFTDPLTDEAVDLTSGTTSMRYLLNPSMSYFNQLGVVREFKDYYTGTTGGQYKQKYQREEWGLENALGKSDVVPSASMYLSDLRMRQQTVFAEIIRGSLPLEAFDAFVDEWNTRGGDILIDEANQLYDDYNHIIREVRRYFE